MKRFLKFALFAAVAAAVAGALLWSFLAHRAELAAEVGSDQPIGSASHVSHGATGETIVKFTAEKQQLLDIRTEPIAAVTKPHETVAYGRLEEDPSRSFVLRAPVSGAVRERPAERWPEVGQTLPDGTVVGAIEPRLAPADRITLGDRLSSARADAESGRATLAAAQAALDRATALNADDKNVSDRAVQEAQARVASEQARVTAANRSIGLIESSLGSMSGAAAPLELDRGGQVVEVLVNPGESVEPGQPIMRVARFDRLLARVDVPAGDVVDGDVAAASIVPVGYENRPVHGERVSLAPAVDPKTQGQPFLFRVSNPSLALRPGLSVTAYLEAPGPPRKGVVIPRAAVVRQSGKTWVYLQTAVDQFVRREVRLEDPTAEGWFSRSLSPGDRVATTGAQTLLSEEFKSQIQVGEESQP
ncbi:MAG TPA: HlyD family efflux transporter periplasmic adaptor subunit [Bryobacteraceae bacterium]|nr:HlyD family efflux transporter periplasmic adaptor subunit [Bryobacteraceae bacterium]